MWISSWQLEERQDVSSTLGTGTFGQRFIVKKRPHEPQEILPYKALPVLSVKWIWIYKDCLNQYETSDWSLIFFWKAENYNSGRYPTCRTTSWWVTGRDSAQLLAHCFAVSTHRQASLIQTTLVPEAALLWNPWWILPSSSTHQLCYPGHWLLCY